ncbi:hypothetical protein JCM11251_000646 [Rhodosporidiobolus azoricus]
MGWTKETGVAGEVGVFKVLQDQPNSDKALTLLQIIASLVKPIMKRHDWYLPELCEFFPDNPHLLGVNYNSGSRIKIRLRPQADPHSFIPLEESLIGTMLHELSHNLRGPHDDQFFKILDGLQDEYDALRASGYSGEGFLGKGTRVGHGVSHDTLNPREAREKALKRLEERERVRKLLGKGGKLGGAAPDTKGKRRGDVLADAAERRLRAIRSCGGDDAHDHPSGSKKEDLPLDVQEAIDAADRNSRRIVVDLTQLDSDEDDELPQAGPSTSRSGQAEAKKETDDAQVSPKKRPRVSPPSSDNLRVFPPPSRTLTAGSRLLGPPSSSSTRSSRPSSHSALTAPRSPSASSSSSAAASSRLTSNPQTLSRRDTPQPAWTCPTCTFGNTSALSLACELCLTERPAGTFVVSTKVGPSTMKETARRPIAAVKDGWECESCSTRNEHVFWTCKACGKMKRSSERG